jgi:pSer/pThr/pTyr-binding forkhead associated (FHA) protein
MLHQLRVVAGGDCGRVFLLHDEDPLVLGRDPGTHIRLKDPQVAMLHCQVVLNGDEAVITDRGSSGGTFVDGKRVGEYILRPGDVFRIGDTRVQFE